MKKAGTTVPAAQNACVVFGALNGNRLAKAGWFSQTEREQAAKLAAKAGLMTITLSATAGPKMSKLVSEGGINARGQLRLQAISDETLGALRDLRAAHNPGPSQAANGAETSGKSSAKPATGAPPPVPAQPPGNPLDLGASLMAACRQVDAAGRWFEKAAVELSEVLSKIGSSSELSFLQETETTEIDHYSGGDGWIFDGWRWTFPARHRRQRLGDLSVVIDLGRPGRPAASVGMPCMLVMWSSATHDWTPAVDAAAGFWPPLHGMTELLGDRVFRWVGKAPGNGPAATLPLKAGAWFYLVRLSGLTNFATLRTHVVQPALALLADKEVETAFSKAPDVLRFRQQQNVFVVAE